MLYYTHLNDGSSFEAGLRNEVSVVKEFFDSVIGGTLDFKALGEIFKGFFTSVTENPGIAALIGGIREFLASIGIIAPIALMVLCLLELFLGKKLFSIQRFVAVALIGYCLGVIIVSPMINQVFALPDYISGAVIAVVLAVLNKYIYFAALAIGVGYSAYVTCINPDILPFLPTKGNTVVSLIVALVAVLIVFLLLKFIEMIGTSVLGAFLLTRVVITYFFDYRTLLTNYAWILDLCIIGVIGLFGAIVQIKTRKRY